MSQTASPHRRLRITSALVLLLAFASGWAFASGAQFASKINTGLVNAFSQVGQNLFGEAVFDAVVVTVT
jgi:hypothetical protein